VIPSTAAPQLIIKLDAYFHTPGPGCETSLSSELCSSCDISDSKDDVFTHKVVPREQDFLLLSPSTVWRDLILVLNVARCGSPELPALVRTC
jgi:hypothetical protein